MKNKLFSIESLKLNMIIVQNRMDDLIESNYWILEDYFKNDNLRSRDEVMNHGLAYNEQRIKLEQSLVLLQTYKKEMDELLKEFASEINKLKEV